MDNFVNLNGRILNPLAQQIQTDCIGIVMNEGVFETMRMINGNIPLAKYHLERLFSGMQILGLDVNEKFSPEFLQDEIHILCKKNNRLESSRIRLQVFRSDMDSAQQENFLSNYLIQNRQLDETNILQGPLKFGIDIFPHTQKVIDKFSSLKSTPCSLYRMATDWARDNHLDACLIFNQEGRVCDGNIYNVFSIFNVLLYTPLTEGCSPVLRRFLLKRGKSLELMCGERV
jgi:branched-chain amino acid aminotransferase